MMRRVPLRRSHGKRASAAEKRHMGRVAALGCCVCGLPATVHHVTSDGHQRLTRNHQRVVPLCLAHHLHDWGHGSVERLGHAGFRDTYGIDLLELADRLWTESERSEAA